MLSKELIGILTAAVFAVAPVIASAQNAAVASPQNIQTADEAQPSATIADTGTGGVATIQQAQDELDDDTTVLWALGGVGVAAAIAIPLALSGGGGGSTPSQTE